MFRGLILGMGIAVLLLVLAAVAGCQHLGQRVELTPLPPGAPRPEQILSSLAANDKAVRSFSAGGTLTLESPDLKAIQRFSFGRIEFRRPADLHVEGRNNLNMALFQLTSAGKEFLIDFPADKSEEPYYSFGERFAGVPFSVSPPDIAREMFLPENWASLKPKEVRLVEYDPQKKTAVMEIGPKRAPRRRLEVMATAGDEWVVVKSERLEHGEVLAVTTKGDYHDETGIMFPAKIDTRFPGQQTRMTFDMRSIHLNTKLKDGDFDVRARAQKLGLNLEELAKKSKANERKAKESWRAQ